MPRPITSPVLCILAAGCGGAAAAGRPDLVSVAERSRWLRTGRADEAVRLCRDFAVAYPGRARCDTFGTTPERRPMVALVVSGDGTLTPAAAATRRRPVLLIQGGIHAGEIEGKDAGFWLLRDLLDGTVAPGALAAVTIVFVPIFNVDGHERFGPNNRPNQRGPVEMGFRTTSQNLNLNRDYTKVDAPEMGAMLDLWRAWDPVLLVDLHTTDGAKFEHDIAVLVAPREPRQDALGAAARALSDGLQARLTALGHLPLPFYPSFVVDGDPATGFTDGPAPPRFSQAYAAARHRLGILVETHSWRTYPERVRSTYHVLQALLERAVRDAAGWRSAADQADSAGARLAGRDVVLGWQPTGAPRTIEFRGYHYERRPSEVSGGIWTIYDETRPEVWRVPMVDALAPALTVKAPRGGYLVMAGFADDVAARLGHHGIAFQRLDTAGTFDAEVFRATKVELGPPFEGRVRPSLLEGAWKRERRAIPAGSLWVPMAQPLAQLAMHLLEPTAPDSLVAWGLFNAVFEQKEGQDSYVTEEIARRMLADPAVKAAFDAALKDPAVAASPQRRLDFFYRRHPSWDERKDLLPIMRLDAAPAGLVPAR